MKRALLVLLVTITFAFAAVAHGDKKHVQGTIEKINSDSIVVKAKDGSSILIKLASTTVFVQRAGNADKSAKASDLAVGDLVVIHATPKDTGLEADEIKFSSRGGHGGASSSANHKS
jgi:ABC-type sulfate transport system substrate-binding protein